MHLEANLLENFVKIIFMTNDYNYFVNLLQAECTILGIRTFSRNEYFIQQGHIK